MQPVEQQIDHWRRVERQHLRHEQAADDRHAERAAHLRARSRRDHERHRTEQGGKRRHHDRTEAFHAGLKDGLLGRQPTLALGFEREIDQHDAVLLDEPDQQDDPDERDDGQLRAE